MLETLLLVPLPLKYWSLNWIFLSGMPSTQISVSPMRKFRPWSSISIGASSLKVAAFIIGIGHISKFLLDFAEAELPAPSYTVIRTFPLRSEERRVGKD